LPPPLPIGSIAYVLAICKGVIESGKKMGRPTDNPKKSRLELRLSDIETQMLEYCVEKTGLSKAEIVRQGISEVYNKTKE